MLSWLARSSQLLFHLADPSQIEVAKHLVNIELVKHVLSTNIFIDQYGQSQSAPLLLGYKPQIGSFLEGPTIPRAQEVRVEPTVLFIA